MAPLAPAHSRLLNHLADLSPDAVRADPPAVSAAIAALAPMLNQAEAFVEVPITLAILRRPPSPRSLKRPADSDLADRADAAHHAAAAAADASDESSSSQPANGADPTTPKDSASRAAKTSRKRLSIDTSLTERTAQLEAAVEAQRIRQKQQAIIEDRRRAASLNLPASALAQSRQRPRPLPSRGDVLSWTAASSSSSSSIDYLISPHADFPNRELPLPRGYTDPRSAHPLSSGRHMLPPAPATAHPSAPGASAHHLLPLPPHLAASASASAAVSGAGGAAANGTANGTTPHKPHININTSLASLPGSGAAAPATGAGAGSSGMPPLSALPPIMSRTAFLGVFESMYDQYESQTRLSIMLKDQIRKSATLLQTLQSSGQMIEGLVRGHFREMQVQYGEKFGAALTDLNRRLVAVEGALGLGSANGSDSFTASGALKSARPDTAGAAAAQAAGFSRGSPDKATAATLASIVERLDAIEKRYAREG
nr:hypothetical protein HK105_001355 [Polyrhizophydium stewartii]